MPSGKSIKTITVIYFVATKFEAFRNRGSSDNFMESKDLEDIFTILAESSDFKEEFIKAHIDVKKYISEQFKKIVDNTNYPYFLSGFLRGDEASQAFLPILRELIEKIASFSF
ncbi:MAG: hypothetical protein ACMUHX_10375 [bacterium]